MPGFQRRTLQWQRGHPKLEVPKDALEERSCSAVVQPVCSSPTEVGSALSALKGKYKMLGDGCEELWDVTVNGRQLRRKLSPRRDIGSGVTSSEMGNPDEMPWGSVSC